MRLGEVTAARDQEGFVKDGDDFKTTTQRRLEDLQRHLEGRMPKVAVKPPSQFRNASAAESRSGELLPYIAAFIFFVFVAAVTIFGPEPRYSNAIISPPAGAPETAQAPAPKKTAPEMLQPPAPERVRPTARIAAPKPQPWSETVAAFQQAIADKKVSEGDADSKKLIEQVRERLSARNSR
jgi:hypothetical protein